MSTYWFICFSTPFYVLLMDPNGTALRLVVNIFVAIVIYLMTNQMSYFDFVGVIYGRLCIYRTLALCLHVP